ncbi:MAG: MoxR family ATPase [Lachnospiraceae bacterium]|nr:MoxR family ATPase [Lachnospiraceae bacterium]
MEKEQMLEIIQKLRNNVKKVIIGKDTVIDLLLTAMLSEGHVLLEDVPGTGKTVLAKSIAKSAGGEFHRIQFTPDLLPSDVTGLNYYNPKEGTFLLRKGPVFTHILLADEINRATPRTQSSLLECMEEKQVTIDGVTYPLNRPFFVIGTQNPIENAGTFPLPEAQLDRFLMKLSMGTPSKEEEIAMMHRFFLDDPLPKLSSVCTTDTIVSLIAAAKNVTVHEDLIAYIQEIVSATRDHEGILLGASPRATLALLRACRSYAFVMGRTYVVPEDIKTLVIPVLGHRLIIGHGRNQNKQASSILQTILDTLPVPSEDWRN